MQKGGRTRGQKPEGCDVRTQATIAAFEDGGKVSSRKCYKQPLKVGKGKKTNSSIKSPEKNTDLGRH